MADRLPFVAAPDGRPEQLQTGDGLELFPFGNGQGFSLRAWTELLTIGTGSSTSTTAVLPGNAMPIACSVRVVTTIPTATTFTVGISGKVALFNNATVSVAAGSTDRGTKAVIEAQSSGDQAIRITPNASPATATGQVRITLYYIVVTPPTS